MKKPTLATLDQLFAGLSTEGLAAAVLQAVGKRTISRRYLVLAINHYEGRAETLDDLENAITIARKGGWEERAKTLYNKYIDICVERNLLDLALKTAQEAGLTARGKELQRLQQIDARQRIEKAIQEGDYKTAAFRTQKAGLWEQALDLYERADDRFSLNDGAAIAERLNQPERARALRERIIQLWVEKGEQSEFSGSQEYSEAIYHAGEFGFQEKKEELCRKYAHRLVEGYRKGMRGCNNPVFNLEEALSYAQQGHDEELVNELCPELIAFHQEQGNLAAAGKYLQLLGKAEEAQRCFRAHLNKLVTEAREAEQCHDRYSGWWRSQTYPKWSAVIDYAQEKGFIDDAVEFTAHLLGSEEAVNCALRHNRPDLAQKVAVGLLLEYEAQGKFQEAYQLADHVGLTPRAQQYQALGKIYQEKKILNKGGRIKKG